MCSRRFSSARNYHRLGTRAPPKHPIPSWTPLQPGSPADADASGVGRANSPARGLAPLRPSSGWQTVVLPPINTFLPPQMDLPHDHTSSLTPTDTEPATPPTNRREALMVASGSGLIIISPRHQLPTSQHAMPVQVHFDETPVSAGVKRTRAFAFEESDLTSVDSWSSRMSINSDEYAPVWQRDEPTHSGTRTRRLDTGRKGKRKAYGYCHYVADDYHLREACTWVPPREIRDERSEESWFRFAERILDWRDRAIKDHGTQEEQDEMVWACGDTPSELRMRRMHATKAAPQRDELQPDDDWAARNSKRRRG